MIDVFKKPLSERGKRMGHYLKQLFGERSVMADIQHHKVILVTALADKMSIFVDTQKFINENI